MLVALACRLRGLLRRVGCSPHPPPSIAALHPPLSVPVQVPQRAVTPDFLSQRSIYLSRQQSRQIQAALRKIGLLDANGWIQYDPRKVRQRGRWASSRITDCISSSYW